MGVNDEIMTESKTIRIEKTLIDAINEIAENENRSWNNTLETLLKFAISNRKVTVTSTSNYNPKP